MFGPLPDWDPELKPIIDGLPETLADPQQVVAGIRARRGEGLSRAETTRGGALAVSERRVASTGGRDVGLTILTPTRDPLRGAIFWLHGGAQVGGAAVGADIRPALEIALKFSLVVVAADYALAPECPAPAGLDDAFAGFAWTAGSADELGYPEGALFLHGISGGAGLAAGTALLARDGGVSYAGLMLDGPMLDDRCSTVSMRQVGSTVSASLRIMWDYVVDGSAGDARDAVRYSAPGRLTGENLSGLPPAYITCGVNDPFRDETTAFAEAIWRSGGVADLHQWAGTRHGGDLLAPNAHVSREIVAARAAWYERILGRLEARSHAVASGGTAG